MPNSPSSWTLLRAEDQSTEHGRICIERLVRAGVKVVIVNEVKPLGLFSVWKSTL